MAVTQGFRRLVTSTTRRLSGRAARVPTVEHSAFQRARVDTSRVVSEAPIRFTAISGCSVAAGTAVGALLAAHLQVVGQIGVAVAAAIVGVFVPVVAILGWSWLRAFPRQRNEARAELDLLMRSSDLAGLSQEFSTWVAAKRAAEPQFGPRLMSAMFHHEHPLAAVYQERDDDLAKFRAHVRAEYHERFRARVIRIVGSDTSDPQTTTDFERLAERLQTLAGDARTAEAVAEAQGTPVTGQHLTNLAVLRDRLHLDVLNENPLEFGDDVGGEPQNRNAFFAHYRTLRPLLETWESAIAGRDASLADVATLIPQEVAKAGLGPPNYVDATIAACFAEDVLPSLRRREYGVRKLQLRCVGDIPGENAENLWSAYLHSGRSEYKIAEVQGPLELSPEGIAEHHTMVVGPDESELQACYEAIHSSAAVVAMKAAQERLDELRQPLIDELRRQKTGASPVFSASCPYCLAGVGI